MLTRRSRLPLPALGLLVVLGLGVLLVAWPPGLAGRLVGAGLVVVAVGLAGRE